MNHELETLSPTGARRRERMLADLKDQMCALHARRRTRRRIAAAGSMILVVGVIVSSAWFASRNRAIQGTNPVVSGKHIGAPNPAESPPAPIVELVRTDPGIVDRWRAQPVSQCVMVSDDELLESLAAANKQTGLIRSRGHTWLTNDVATEATPPPSNSSSSGMQSTSVAHNHVQSSPRG